MVFSITSVISKKPILFFRNAYTAISFAAFKTQGILPPLSKASCANAKFLNVLTYWDV
jgi:hypothetical protein